MAQKLTDSISIESFQNKFQWGTCFLLNDTSRTEILDSKKMAGIQLKEHSCQLQIPINFCSKGHYLTIFFLFPESPLSIKRMPSTGEIEHTLRVKAQVKKIYENPHSDESMFIQCDFTQYSKQHWEDYLKKSISTQIQIFEDFKKIKGE